ERAGGRPLLTRPPPPEGDGGFLQFPNSDRRPLIVARRALPLLDALADYLHRRHCGVAQARITGDLAADTLAFTAQHLAHRLQFRDGPVDLLHRRAGDAADETVEVVGDRRRRVRCRRLLTRTSRRGRDVTAHEFADLAFERVRGRVADRAELLDRAALGRGHRLVGP